MNERSLFIGRQEIVTELLDFVAETELVTIVGTGGVGKTRLAIRTAAEAEEEFPDGTSFVELAHLRSGGAIPDSVAAGLGFNSFDAAVSALGDTAALIVLDNCEHVVGQVVEVVAELLARCPDLRILATSRVPLELPGEVVYRLDPLTPNEALELLRDRATRAGARLAADDQTDNDLEALAARVDHLPLALELAAIRLRSLSPAEVAAALDESGDLLTTGRPDVDRQSSLSGAIAWSYDLLSESAARALLALSIFQGTFTLERAHAIAAEPGDSLVRTADLLDQLVAQSLVSAVDDAGSYRLLETIRDFALERLTAAGNLPATRDHYLDHIQTLSADLIEAGTSDWSNDLVETVLAFAPELLVALRLCLQHDDASERAFTCFIPAWGIVHHQHAAEVASIGQRMLDKWPDSADQWWPDVAAITATAFMRIANQEKASEYAKTALAAGGGLVAGPIAHRVLGLVHQHRGQWERALSEVAAGIAAGEALDLGTFVGELKVFEATLVGQTGDATKAIELAKQARIRNSEHTSGNIYRWALVQEAYLLSQAEPERTVELSKQAISAISLADAHWIVPRHLGIMALSAGDPVASAGWFRMSLDASRASGDVPHTWATIVWIAVAAARGGPALHDTAGAVLAACEANPRVPALSVVDQRAVAAVKAAIGTDRFPMAKNLVFGACYELLDRLQQAAPGEAAQGHVVERPMLRRQGEIWTLGWRGDRADVGHVKGFSDLRRLVEAPGKEFHCLELMGSRLDESSAGVIDETARRQYEDRLRDLQQDIDEAETNHDIERAELAQDEFDQVLSTLSAALGLGGRNRSSGASAEKARSAATWRIRAAVKKINPHLPGMARHFRLAVNTGAWCSYQPEEPLDWETS